MRSALRIALPVTVLALSLSALGFLAHGVTVHTVDDQSYQGRIEAGLPESLALRVEGSIVRVDRTQMRRLSFGKDGVAITTVAEESYQGTLNTELPETLALSTRSATVEIPYAEVDAITFERPASLLAQVRLPLNVGIGLAKRAIPLVALQDGMRPLPAGVGTWTPSAVWEIPLSQEQASLSSGPYDVPLEQTRTAMRIRVGLNRQDLNVEASRVNLSAWQIATDYVYYVGQETLGRPMAIGVFVGEQRNFALVQLSPYVSGGLGLAVGAVGPPIASGFASLEAHAGGGLRVNVNVSNVSIHAGAQARFLPIALVSGNGPHGRVNLQAGLVFNF